MLLSQRSLPRQRGRAVLLSIKPKYADLILGGSKRVEFRRSWAAEEVGVIVLYASSPIQKIVGVVEVDEILVASQTSLWRICTERGGGLTRDSLRDYFAGKSQGFAVLLGKVFKLTMNAEPSNVIENFVPPQSFRYLTSDEYIKIEKMLSARKGRP